MRAPLAGFAAAAALSPIAAAATARLLPPSGYHSDSFFV